MRMNPRESEDSFTWHRQSADRPPHARQREMTPSGKFLAGSRFSAQTELQIISSLIVIKVSTL